MQALFYTCNAALLAVLAIAIWGMFRQARHLRDDSFQLRRKSFAAVFITMLLYVASTFTIYSHGRVEVLSTLAVCLHYTAMVTFIMASCAFFGRNYYRSVLTWAFFMQYPVVMLVLHIIMRATGRYVKLYSASELLRYEGNDLGLFWGRVIWLAMLTFCLLFLLCMLVGAYVHYRKRPTPAGLPASRLNWQKKDVRYVPCYLVLNVGMMGSLFTSSLWPYVVLHLLTTVMFVRTFMVYNRYMHYIEHLASRREAFLHIPVRLMELAEQERNNPLYKSNATLDEIAAALDVSRKDLSDYLYEELNTTFPSWTSEQKLSHFTKQLLRTDRKISELAMACGYASITALNRAFKARYGMSPSDYRDKTTPKTDQLNVLSVRR